MLCAGIWRPEDTVEFMTVGLVFRGNGRLRAGLSLSSLLPVWHPGKQAGLWARKWRPGNAEFTVKQ